MPIEKIEKLKTTHRPTIHFFFRIGVVLLSCGEICYNKLLLVGIFVVVVINSLT